MELEESRVLIVDDDPGVREILRLTLADEGYAVRTASNGLEALELLKDWRPDLIVLDLMMPILDGWGFRARQLAESAWAPIPVLVLSAAHELRRQAAILGAAAVVGKPFDLDTFLATVSRLTAQPEGLG